MLPEHVICMLKTCRKIRNGTVNVVVNNIATITVEQSTESLSKYELKDLIVLCVCRDCTNISTCSASGLYIHP